MVLVALYTITRHQTGETYVGVTNNPIARWKNHLRRAKSGSTTPIHAALTEFGEKAFEFEVNELLESEDEATLQEAYWIARLREFGVSLYNRQHRVPKKRKLGKKEVSEILGKAQRGKEKTQAHCDALREAALRRWAQARSAGLNQRG